MEPGAPTHQGLPTAGEELAPARCFLLGTGPDRYPVGNEVEAIGLRELAAELLARRAALPRGWEPGQRADPWGLSSGTVRPLGRRVARDAASPPWLREALRELAEIGEGVEVEGPTPSAEIVAEARALLRRLAEWADDAPAVDDDADGGVSVEFYGRKGCRLLLIVESDGSAVYQELVAGRVTTQGFASWRQLLETCGLAAFRRTGVPIRGEPKPPRDLRSNECLGRRVFSPRHTRGARARWRPSGGVAGTEGGPGRSPTAGLDIKRDPAA